MADDSASVKQEEKDSSRGLAEDQHVSACSHEIYKCLSRGRPAFDQIFTAAHHSLRSYKPIGYAHIVRTEPSEAFHWTCFYRDPTDKDVVKHIGEQGFRLQDEIAMVIFNIGQVSTFPRFAHCTNNAIVQTCERSRRFSSVHGPKSLSILQSRVFKTTE